MDHTATYDRAAPTWDRSLASLGYHTAYQVFLDGRTLPDGPVLDIGAGTGAFSGAWLSAGGSAALTLLDPSPQMLARAASCCANHGARPEQVCTTLERFDPPHGFRTILAAHVIELCPCPETAMVRIADLLIPGGQLFLIVSRPHWCN